ncbi:hypothetical protein MANI_012958 [Metarhizium anisopliae]|nr:hypothetical protein MANI_012958 [Metarhizium anisopliae]
MSNGSASATSNASNNSAAPGSAASPLSVDGGASVASQGQAPAIKRRSPIACRRCRRMRSKCVHEKGKPPCKSCHEAGIPAEEWLVTLAPNVPRLIPISNTPLPLHSIFPVRGQPDLDREYRHPRTRAEKTTRSGSISSKPRRCNADGSLVPQQRQADNWENLPPLEELIDGVNLFTKQYFQLGFIPKEQYPERLRKDSRSTSLFLLMGILSISARLSPAFKLRYGTGVKAAEYFMERASSIAFEEVYQEPTLERCQAFYLLSIAQQGSGERNRSYVRPLSPVSLSAGDITTLLPCNEEDFANGHEPRSRAALEGTPPAMDHPELIRDSNRSLFATLMQIHSWWGVVGRRAVRFSKSPRPWDPASAFSQTAEKLREWEEKLPQEHRWSTYLLQRYKAESQELAYFIIKPDKKGHTKFFTDMSNEIFINVRYLYEQIDAQFTNRSPDESVGAQIAAFCVYSCGLFSTYLCKYPSSKPPLPLTSLPFSIYKCNKPTPNPPVCQDKALVRDGPMMLQRTINILKECREVWPLAARWVEALEKFSLDPQSATFGNEGSMDDGKDPIPRFTRQLPPLFPITKPILPPAPPPTLPGPNILPRPGTQPELPPSSSIGSPHHQSAISNPAPSLQLPSPPQQQTQPQLHQSQGYPGATLPVPATISPHPYANQLQPPHAAVQPNSHNMYMHTPMGRQNADSLSMLIEAFDSNNPGPPAPHYGAGNFNPQLVPGTDGFEGELQFYIDGATSAWMNSSAWLDTMQ